MKSKMYESSADEESFSLSDNEMDTSNLPTDIALMVELAKLVDGPVTKTMMTAICSDTIAQYGDAETALKAVKSGCVQIERMEDEGPGSSTPPTVQ